MRIKIGVYGVDSVELMSNHSMSEQEARRILNLAGKDIWINDFPCRLNEGDRISFDLLGKEWEQYIEYFGDPVVNSCYFEQDERGLFQFVEAEFE